MDFGSAKCPYVQSNLILNTTFTSDIFMKSKKNTFKSLSVCRFFNV